MPKSLFEKVWDRHLVKAEAPDSPGVLYIDLHLVHEVTSPQAFSVLESRGLSVRRPDRTFATIDHSIPTLPFKKGVEEPPYFTPEGRSQVLKLQENAKRHGIPLYGWDSENRGIVHVIGPELGLTQPGMTVVCGDSHTSTHGAFGALAFGIGTTEVGHVLATQCLLQRKPKTMRISFDGELSEGVTAKDMALAMIAAIGASGGTGYVLEFDGPAIEKLSMEGRMTLCNMSIEAGARAGMVAPDETTFAFLKGREHAPKGADWSAAVEDWKSLRSDEGAKFDKEVRIDASKIEPMVTFGTSPDYAIGVGDSVPAPTGQPDRDSLTYMKLDAGAPITRAKVDRVFIGSCTNSRMSDLRAAADVLRGRKVAEGVIMLVVPGSEAVRQQAEAEGLHTVFEAAGAQWRLPGCSMCIAMNGDKGEPGELVVSTSNRNFMGRQGKDVRTVLASPATAAASAVAGHIADPRDYTPAVEKKNVA